MRKLTLLLSSVVLVVLGSTEGFAQMANTDTQRSSDMQAEIASLEGQRKSGMYMTAGGVAVQFLSLALVPSSDVDYYTGEVSNGSWVPFYLVLGAGTVPECVNKNETKLTFG